MAASYYVNVRSQIAGYSYFINKSVINMKLDFAFQRMLSGYDSTAKIKDQIYVLFAKKVRFDYLFSTVLFKMIML